MVATEMKYKEPGVEISVWERAMGVRNGVHDWLVGWVTLTERRQVEPEVWEQWKD